MSDNENLVKGILEAIEGDSAYDGNELREGLKNTPKYIQDTIRIQKRS